MKKMLFILLAAMLIGCGKPRPMTFEEQQAYMAKQQCAETASNMNPEWPNSNNPAWTAYFLMCMHEFGIPNSVIDRMWY